KSATKRPEKRRDRPAAFAIRPLSSTFPKPTRLPSNKVGLAEMHSASPCYSPISRLFQPFLGEATMSDLFRLPLAEKYRPKCLDEVIGQPKLVAQIQGLQARGGLGGCAYLQHVRFKANRHHDLERCSRRADRKKIGLRTS